MNSSPVSGGSMQKSNKRSHTEHIASTAKKLRSVDDIPRASATMDSPKYSSVQQKIHRCQLNLLESIELLEIKLTRAQRQHRSHNRTQQMLTMLHTSAAKIIALRANESLFTTDRMIHDMAAIYEHLDASMVFLVKYCYNLDSLADVSVQLFEHVQCVTEMYQNLCVSDPNMHMVKGLLEKVQMFMSDMSRVISLAGQEATSPTKENIKPTQKPTNKLSMYASGTVQQRRRRPSSKNAIQTEKKFNQTKCVSKRFKAKDNIKGNCLKSIDANTISPPSKSPSTSQNAQWPCVPKVANSSPEFTDAKLKFLQETFVSKKELWTLIQTLKVALVSCNPTKRHSSDVNTTMDMDVSMDMDNNNNDMPPSFRTQNMETVIQYAKNVQLIEITADDGIETPRCTLEPLESAIKLSTSTSAMDCFIDYQPPHLQPTTKNPLYANEHHAEPWKVVTSIANTIFHEQIEHVLNTVVHQHQRAWAQPAAAAAAAAIPNMIRCSN